MVKIIDRLAKALDGQKLATSGYGTYLLATKVWEKNGVARIYVDGRFVGSDGRINAKIQRLGHIELLTSGDVVYATKAYHEPALREMVEPILAEIAAPTTR